MNIQKNIVLYDMSYLKLIFGKSYCFLAVLILLGCKKDKLVDDYAIFNGNWKIDHIIKITNTHYPPDQTRDTIYANEIPNEYWFEFEEKGILRQIKNDTEIHEDRVVFDQFYSSNFGSTPLESQYFLIHLNNIHYEALSGHIFGDTIRVSGQGGDHVHVSGDYPNEDGSQENVDYIFYFIKQ